MRSVIGYKLTLHLHLHLHLHTYIHTPTPTPPPPPSPPPPPPPAAPATPAPAPAAPAPASAPAPCLCASNISAFRRKYFCLPGRKYFAFQEAHFVSAVKPMFSDVRDTNISATMFLTFDEGFSFKKNI